MKYILVAQCCTDVTLTDGVQYHIQKKVQCYEMEYHKVQ